MRNILDSLPKPFNRLGNRSTHLGLIERLVPYPLRAARLDITICFFPYWKPIWNFNTELSEARRKEGDCIWWIRWLWIGISYKRWA